MSEKLEVVLSWAERLAAAVSTAVPTIRQVVVIMTGNQPEVVLISNDED